MKNKICLICCRGGSKTIKDKNIKIFAGKPLLSWILEESLKSKVFDRIILSTDSEKIQNIGFKYDGIIINAGGFTHTSVAIRDAISSVESPAIEVHISNILSREDFRKNSFLSDVCIGIISGLGLIGYDFAINYFNSK